MDLSEDPLDDVDHDCKEGSDDAKTADEAKTADSQDADDEKQWSRDITKAADAGKPKPKPKLTEAQLAAFEADAQRLLYLLNARRIARARYGWNICPRVSLPKTPRAELIRLNPFLPAGAEAQLIDLLIAFMLRVNRIDASTGALNRPKRSCGS